MKGEITIFCLLEEEFLSNAAERFMDMYPDVKITINSYKESSGANMIADYQTYLNTKIMTGDVSYQRIVSPMHDTINAVFI